MDNLSYDNTKIQESTEKMLKRSKRKTDLTRRLFQAKTRSSAMLKRNMANANSFARKQTDPAKESTAQYI